MRLTTADLRRILGILERIDCGRAEPQVPGRIGRFLRQYKHGRRRLDEVLARNACARREDAAISGVNLGPTELHAFTHLRLTPHGFPTGDVGEALAVSDQLGALVNVILWLKGPRANAAYNTLREHHALQLSGDYRWTPPSRLTSGEAVSKAAPGATRWDTARSLKSVADDFLRPAHALEYVLDYHLGPPGLKFFRCVCVRREGSYWEVLPAFSTPRRLEVEAVLPTVDQRVRGASFATVLIYTEPWLHSWIIVDAIPITPNEALTHAIVWADFREELSGVALQPSALRELGDRYEYWGASLDELELNLARVLLPIGRQVVRSLRGYS